MSNDQSFKNRKPAMGKAEPGTIKRIFSYIFQYKWRVIAIVVCILVGAAAQAGPASHAVCAGRLRPSWSTISPSAASPPRWAWPRTPPMTRSWPKADRS